LGKPVPQLGSSGKRVSRLSLALGFLAAYLLLDQISFIHPLQELNITPWNPQPALAVALMLINGWRWIVWVFATVLAAEFVVRGLPVPLSSAMVLSGILSCGYAGIAILLRGPFDIALDLASRRDVLRLAAAIVVGAGATGVLYVGVLSLGHFIVWTDFAGALLRYWIGDSIGMLVTLPFLMLLADHRRRRELRMLVVQREVLLQFALVIALLFIVFARGELEQFKYFYLLFLPLIWIAARRGLAGAILAVSLIQAGIIVFITVEGHQTLTVFELQTLLLALVLTGLSLGASVDEWRFASERLARSQQLTAAGEMATALAHELNQPLTALSTYADAIRLLAESGKDDKTSLIDTAERIRRVATRSADIVSRFRSLAATSSNQTEYLPISDPLQRAIDALSERITHTRAVLHVNLASELPLLRLDRNRIAFVFQNLIANALEAIDDAAPGDRNVVITVRADGKHVMLTVCDSGSGIDPAAIDKLFEPFYTSKVTGMGLGLAISRSIVESHGGRLWAEPAEYGTFHVRLPV
jgi:signal transduction histidine kinase